MLLFLRIGGKIPLDKNLFIIYQVLGSFFIHKVDSLKKITKSKHKVDNLKEITLLHWR